jgi:hypothetical protein
MGNFPPIFSSFSHIWRVHEDNQKAYFISQTIQQMQNDHLQNEAWKEFILSRKAMLCSPATIEWYQFDLLPFLILTLKLDQHLGVRS